MILSGDQVAQLRRDGYVIVPGLLERREAQAMATEIDRLRAWLTGPQASEGEREYGVRLSGVFRSEAERLVAARSAS